ANADSPNKKQRFLGEFGGPAIVTAPPYDPQHFVRVDETVTLTLNDLSPHSSATLSFDLYVLKSWDGNNPNYGPDRWSLTVDEVATLLDTTFSNNPKTGPYDLSLQNYPGANSLPQTSASAVNSLGYSFYGDSIYHLTFTFPHASESMVVRFSSSLFEGKGTDDESWGLDNVRVSTSQDRPAAAWQTDYFPLRVGNQWIYRVTGFAGTTSMVIKVAGQRTIADQMYFAVTGFPGRDLLLRETSEGTLLIYDPAAGSERVWVDFGASEGATFDSAIDPCS